MKNKNIELVKKWLNAPKSVSKEDLRRAANAAEDDDIAAADADTDAAFAVGFATYCAAFAAFASDADTDDAGAAAVIGIATAAAKHWVERYGELTK